MELAPISSSSSSTVGAFAARRSTKWATGDDRFSFPMISGYTGYIPRSQDYFGKSYVPSTFAALSDFKAHKKPSPSEVPAHIQSAIEHHARYQPAIRQGNLPPYEIGGGHGCKYYSNEAPQSTTLMGKQKPFVSGYTGFIPQLRSRFGEPYARSVRSSIGDFNARREAKHVAEVKGPTDTYGTRDYSALTHYAHIPAKSTQLPPREPPIPGFTGVTRARVKHDPTTPPKDLSQQLPVPGYRGHIPGFIFSAETSYGKSSSKCISNFHRTLDANKIQLARDIQASRRQL